LAGIFSLSGFSFALFFPLQVLLGSVASVLVAMVAMRSFENSLRVGLYSGLAAAAHPVLVNTASQPYNENVYFFLFFLSLLVFLRWMDSRSLPEAIICGVLVGLTTLTREAMIAPFVVMLGFSVFAGSSDVRKVIGTGVAMVAAAALTVAPWSLHNYYRYGIFVPVSSITGTALGMANNDCVSAGTLLTPFDGEQGCASLDSKRFALLQEMPKEPDVVWSDRAYAQLGRTFVLQHPADYLRLCIRRAWTTFLPYHPRQAIAAGKKLILVGYFVVVIIPGLASVFLYARRVGKRAKLLLCVAAATYIPLVLVYVSADLRYRVGVDLILGCFAGYLTAIFVNRWLSTPRLSQR
jgi:hypothetical protein